MQADVRLSIRPVLSSARDAPTSCMTLLDVCSDHRVVAIQVRMKNLITAGRGC